MDISKKNIVAVVPADGREMLLARAQQEINRICGVGKESETGHALPARRFERSNVGGRTAVAVRKRDYNGSDASMTEKLTFTMVFVCIVFAQDYLTKLVNTDFCKNKSKGVRMELLLGSNDIRLSAKRCIEGSTSVSFDNFEALIAEVVDNTEYEAGNAVDQIKRSAITYVRYNALDAFAYSVIVSGMMKQAFAFANMFNWGLNTKIDKFLEIFYKFLCKIQKSMMFDFSRVCTTEEIKFFGHRLSDKIIDEATKLLQSSDKKIKIV